MTRFDESHVEDAALEWLAGSGWTVVKHSDIASDAQAAERTKHDEVVLESRLRDALARLNPNLPIEAETKPSAN